MRTYVGEERDEGRGERSKEDLFYLSHCQLAILSLILLLSFSFSVLAFFVYLSLAFFVYLFSLSFPVYPSLFLSFLFFFLITLIPALPAHPTEMLAGRLKPGNTAVAAKM